MSPPPSATPGYVPTSPGVVHDLNVGHEHALHDAVVMLTAVQTIADLTVQVLAVRQLLDQLDQVAPGMTHRNAANLAVQDIRTIVGY